MSQVSQIVQSLGVPLWQHKREFIAFCEWIKLQQYKSVLEIGTGFGGSAYVFGEMTGHGRVVTVDWGKLVPPERRKRQTNPNFVQLVGDARTDEIETLVAQYAPFDLVYLDGEHSYEDVIDHHKRYVKFATHAVAQHDINMDVAGWTARGDDAARIPLAWAELTNGKWGEEFIDPDPDLRFPRWGGIGVYFV